MVILEVDIPILMLDVAKGITVLEDKASSVVLTAITTIRYKLRRTASNSLNLVKSASDQISTN